MSPRAASLGVFVLALALRLGFVLTLDERLAWPDEQDYVDIGRHLAAGDGFVASSYRNAPVLPTYLALTFRLFGDGYLAARVGQAVLGALACVLVARTGALLVSPAVGALAGAILALYPPQIYLAGVFYTSCLETVLCTATVLLAARVLRRRGGAGTAALCGVALGLTVLTRPAYVVLLPCLALVWLVGALPRVRAAAAVAALALAAAAVVLPWSARNRLVYGRLLLVSSGGGITLWKGNNELTDGTADDRFLGWDRPLWEVRRARLAPDARAALDARYAEVRARVLAREQQVGDYYLAMDDVLGPVARAYMAADPVATIRRTARKLVTFFSAFSRTSTPGIASWSAVVAALAFYPLLALALLAPALGPGRGAALVLPYAVVASMAAVHALLTSCTRFRLPVDPWVILGAAAALVALVARRPTSGR